MRVESERNKLYKKKKNGLKVKKEINWQPKNENGVNLSEGLSSENP